MSGPSPDVGQPNQVRPSLRDEGSVGGTLIRYFNKQATKEQVLEAMVSHVDAMGKDHEVTINDDKILPSLRTFIESLQPPSSKTELEMVKAGFHVGVLQALLNYTSSEPLKQNIAGEIQIYQDFLQQQQPTLAKVGEKRSADSDVRAPTEVNRSEEMEGQIPTDSASDQIQTTPAPDQATTVDQSQTTPALVEPPNVPVQVNPLQPGATPVDTAATLSFQGDTNAQLAYLVAQLKELKDRTLPDEKMEIDAKLDELKQTFNAAMEQIRLEEKTIDNQHQLALTDMQLKQVQTHLEVAREHNASVAERKELENARLKDSETYALGMANANVNLTNTMKTSEVALRKIDTELKLLEDASKQRTNEHQQRLKEYDVQNHRIESNFKLAEQRVDKQHQESIALGDRQMKTSFEQFKIQSENRQREHEASLKALESKEKADERRHKEQMEATAKQAEVQLASIHAQQEMATKREDRLLQDAKEERILREKIALQQADAARQAAQMRMMNDTPANAKHFLMQIKAMLAEEKKVKPPPAKKIKS